MVPETARELRLAAQANRIIATALWEGGSTTYDVYDKLAAAQERRAAELEKENGCEIKG